MRQKSEQLELALEARGEAPDGRRSGEAPMTSNGDERSGGDHRLMEQVVARANALAALKRVKQNQGSPGVDGMTVDDLSPYLAEHWETIREHLLAGSYQPQPVRRAEIPKPGGGTRQLGIPTVLDRFIQQCLLQVLQPQFDPTFSEHSYGFRPGRSGRRTMRWPRSSGCSRGSGYRSTKPRARWHERGNASSWATASGWPQGE